MRTVLFISFAFNLLIAAGGTYFVIKKGGWGYVKTKYYEVTDGSPHTDPGRPFYESSIYKQDTSIHALAPVQEGDVVFLGDSHAAVGQWSEFFGTTRVKNRGISGDNTEGVLSRLSPVLEGNPAAIFLFIGSNDVDKRYKGFTVEETVANVEQIISGIRETSPSTAVYLMSAPPKSRNTSANLTETPLAHALNDQYELLAEELDIVYVDIERVLTDEDGTLRVDYTEDGGHLNGAGYQAILEVITPFVEQELGNLAATHSDG